MIEMIFVISFNIFFQKKVSFVLMKIVDVAEVEHSIDIQFEVSHPSGQRNIFSLSVIVIVGA